MDIIRKAMGDTWKGQLKAVFSLVAGTIVALLALHLWKGTQVAVEEIPYALTGLAGAIGALVLLFLWNLIAAPYRLQRARADNFESELADLKRASAKEISDLRQASTEEIADLRQASEEARSPKARIRSILEEINPGILHSVDGGENDLYVVASEAKFHRLLEETDNPRGRQLVRAIRNHGIDLGHNSRMRDGDPFRDAVTAGTKHHFTLEVQDALRS